MFCKSESQGYRPSLTSTSACVSCWKCYNEAETAAFGGWHSWFHDVPRFSSRLANACSIWLAQRDRISRQRIAFCTANRSHQIAQVHQSITGKLEVHQSRCTFSIFASMFPSTSAATRRIRPAREGDAKVSQSAWTKSSPFEIPQNPHASLQGHSLSCPLLAHRNKEDRTKNSTYSAAVAVNCCFQCCQMHVEQRMKNEQTQKVAQLPLNSAWSPWLSLPIAKGQINKFN